MKINIIKPFLQLSFAALIYLSACKKPGSGSGGGTTVGNGKLFSVSTGNDEKIKGILFDSATNGLYVLEQIDTTNCAIIKYDFGRQVAYPVYTDSSKGTDGGIRSFGDSVFYLVKTGDKRIDLLKKDSNSFQLKWIDSIRYPTQYGGDAFGDLAVFGSNAYFVMNPYVATEKGNAISLSPAPFDDWSYLANASATGEWSWNGVDPISRSLVANQNYLIVAPGGTNKIEARDRQSGQLVSAVDGPGNSYLQQDFHRRVYAIDRAAGKLVRWNFDLTGREDFAIPGMQASKTAPSGTHVPFAIRESPAALTLFYPVAQAGGIDIYQLSLPQ